MRVHQLVFSDRQPAERDAPRRHGGGFRWQQAFGGPADIPCDAKPFFRLPGETEKYLLPAPLFETPGDFTRAVLFAQRPLREMDHADRSRACYLHACLRHVEREPMTNTSLRQRLGIEAGNEAIASRVIREALADGLIRAYDPDQGRKFARYLPFWA